MVSPFKSGGRKRHRNRHHGGASGGAGAGGGGGVGGISAAQMSVSESGRSEVRTSTPLPGLSLSCSALDISKESGALSGGAVNSHEPSAESSAGCRDESVSLEDSSASGAPNQHTSRRKRRRNSGKLDPPMIHSTPVGKPGPAERSCGSGGPRSSQSSFHTPRIGFKLGPGGRQHQQPHHQVREQQKKKFQYGNYNKYYGYRNPGAS
ncbi:hypothetical protein GBF38_019195, partial [Nibea albiflora]